VKVNFIVAEEIAMLSRPFSKGECLKSCMIKVCNVLCPDNMQMLGNVSMSSVVINSSSRFKVHSKNDIRRFLDIN